MKILVDTNILLSAMWFKDSRVAEALLFVAKNCELVLCEHNITEMREVLKRKTPDVLGDADVFLYKLKYTLIVSAGSTEKIIRDPKDQPILDAAITNKVDIILTGDKDFLSLKLKNPKIMTVSQFLNFVGRGENFS